jgi:hypothetical protein
MISDTKKQFETHHITLRWSAFTPFAGNYSSPSSEFSGRIELNMFGVEKNNPSFKLVFKRPDTNMQDRLSSKTAPGKITFEIRKGNQVIDFSVFFFASSYFIYVIANAIDLIFRFNSICRFTLDQEWTKKTKHSKTSLIYLQDR